MDMIVYYTDWYMDLYPVFLTYFTLEVHLSPRKRGAAQTRFLHHMPS